MSDSVSPEVLELAKKLALECEIEQRPNHVQQWDEMPEYLRKHFTYKAQRTLTPNWQG